MSDYVRPIVVPSLQDLHCASCSGNEWMCNITYTVILNKGQRFQAKDEIRCCRCNKRASKELDALIRQTREFAEMRRVEVARG